MSHLLRRARKHPHPITRGLSLLTAVAVAAAGLLGMQVVSAAVARAD